VTDIDITPLFKKYQQETYLDEYYAGITIFKHVYSEMMIHKSKHGNMDLYGCLFVTIED